MIRSACCAKCSLFSSLYIIHRHKKTHSSLYDPQQYASPGDIICHTHSRTHSKPEKKQTLGFSVPPVRAQCVLHSIYIINTNVIIIIINTNQRTSASSETPIRHHHGLDSERRARPEGFPCRWLGGRNGHGRRRHHSVCAAVSANQGHAGRRRILAARLSRAAGGQLAANIVLVSGWMLNLCVGEPLLYYI